MYEGVATRCRSLQILACSILYDAMLWNQRGGALYMDPWLGLTIYKAEYDESERPHAHLRLLRDVDMSRAVTARFCVEI